MDGSFGGRFGSAGGTSPRRTISDRTRRNQLEQLQSDARALERALADVEEEIAKATRDVEAALRNCVSVETRLGEVRAEVRRQVRARGRVLAREKPRFPVYVSAEDDRGGGWGALGMGAIVAGFAPWEFHGLTSAHVFIAGAALVLVGFFGSDLFHGLSAEGRSEVL